MARERPAWSLNRVSEADVVFSMTPARRWWLVAIAVALVVGGPIALRARPVGGQTLSAAETLALVRSADHGYSGTVELAGNLQLPVTSRFTDVGELLRERTTLRVWWRGSDDWRVDKLLLTGETDLVHDATSTTQWRYEGARVVRSVDPDVRLPRSADLLPPELATRALDGVTPAAVSRLPSRRVAGSATVGLRIERPSSRSSVDHVDLWADPDTGIVLRLDLYAVGDHAPSFSTRFTDFTGQRPSAATTRFTTPPGAEASFDDVLDIADAANQYAPFTLPDTVAGMRRAARPDGAVGVFGSGLTRILVIPLRRRDAETLMDQIRVSPGGTVTEVGPALQAGPLGVLVADGDDVSWLVAGTVTQDTLVAAARDLAAEVRFQ
jgi:hypothetical protein